MSFPNLFLSAFLLLQSGGVQFPALTVDAGTVHVVWQDEREGNAEIYYSRAGRQGAFSQARNISHTPGTSDLPRVSANRNLVNVVWSDSTSGTYRIMLAQSTDSGQTFTSPRILSSGAGSAGPPDIATDDQGRIAIVWDEAQPDGARRIMFWKDAAGAKDIASGNGGLTPSIAVKGEKIVVAWHTDSLYEQHVYVTQSSDAGRSFAAPVLVSAKLGRSMTPSVSFAADGRSAVCWVDQTVGKAGVYVAFSDPGGQTYSEPKALPYSAREILFPVIQVVGEDDASVAWTTRESIVFGRISFSGELKAPVRTLSVSSRVGPPRLAVDAENPMIIWSESRSGTNRVVLSKDSRSGEPIF
jgi:hypothetical protein